MAGPRRRRPGSDPTMPEIARIGQSFADRRIALHLTQQTLADLAGVSRSTVQALERGSGSVKFGSVIEIAEVLGMHIHTSAAS